ncbi:hypothetical protein JTE90_009526 [Oedothorax gibbosus]|uniref:Cytochrome c biogenesis B n=1 Tax=Oedothorax gibbosus TaxID=931172 RepID=A0AAV6USJ4_9ARAC|nr:hypothetical protein JTE90_009526 [Oedothorax gibbosus]
MFSHFTILVEFGVEGMNFPESEGIFPGYVFNEHPLWQSCFILLITSFVIPPIRVPILQLQKKDQDISCHWKSPLPFSILTPDSINSTGISRVELKK